MTPAELADQLARFPSLPLVGAPTPVEALTRLSAALGGGARLLVKRDDAVPFAFGGNKVRKLAFVAADARAGGADTLITAGGVQSNHARVTAAAAAKLGMRAVLVANGAPPSAVTANALLDRLLGAEVTYVSTRGDRAPKMAELAEQLRAEGRRPYVIPIGASIPLGALAFVAAAVELVAQMPPPDVIVHSSSSGGTQAGLVAACHLLGLPTRIVGVSADASSNELEADVRALVRGVFDLLNVRAADFDRRPVVEVDDGFVGGGYGVASDASREAIDLAARTEALFLDPVYTAKAMAALIAYVRQGRFSGRQTVLFWHTGGQVALFA